MTELDLYLQCIPMIATIAARCQNLSAQHYEEWKSKTISSSPEDIKGFLEKAFIVIDIELEWINQRNSMIFRGQEGAADGQQKNI